MNWQLDEVLWPDTPFPLREHLILVGRRGSEAHGTYVPSTDPNSIDDRDLFGVVIAPLDYYFGLRRWEHAESIKECWDVVLDETRKWCNMLVGQNPNVIQGLYLEPEDYLWFTDAGSYLVSQREVFRSRDAALRAFIGYAHGQLKRMTTIGAYKGYMGDKRKMLVDRFGFDTKNAAHLLRLLYVGEEYIRTGTMHVRRTGDEVRLLLSVKRGEVALADVQALADAAFQRVYAASADSPLPPQPDYDRVNAVVRETFRIHLQTLGANPIPARSTNTATVLSKEK